jgi:hypothetical protein
MRQEHSVTFEITATNMNLADSTDQTLVTFPNDGRIRVPERIELRREAGTAYTISNPDGVDRKLVEGDVPDSYAEGFSGGLFLRVVEKLRNGGGGRTWFRVGLPGFIDVATEQDRVSFPNRNSRDFKPTVTSLILRLSGAVSAGTGSVKGTIFFKEYGPTLPIGR